MSSHLHILSKLLVIACIASAFSLSIAASTVSAQVIENQGSQGSQFSAGSRETCTVEGGTRAAVCLIEPLGRRSRIPVLGGAGTFLTYFDDISGFIMVVAIGFCVLWILIGGYFIMVSGSDSGKRSKGKEIITWAAIGLVIITFAGFVLRTLNSIFYT